MHDLDPYQGEKQDPDRMGLDQQHCFYFPRRVNIHVRNLKMEEEKNCILVPDPKPVRNVLTDQDPTD
jgi:hypothetical protein